MKSSNYSRSYSFVRATITLLVCLGINLAGLVFISGTARAQLVSLKTVPVPEPPNLSAYVRDRNAAIQLGKALFWDMQVGSDGVQACATCHFHAGADSRSKNQVNPGMNGRDNAFNGADAPNSVLRPADFPFRKLNDPDFADSGLARPDNNDVVSSQGIVLTRFVDIRPGNPVDLGTPLNDPVFSINGVNIRRVATRNTPSVINAAFNFTNFWDGRANNVFNGVNPFGAADRNARIFSNRKAGATEVLSPVVARIRNASLASQATGPPLSDFEMSFRGRTWPKIGKKMLSLPPLALQVVHPDDSVLGPIAKSTATTRVKGLRTTYDALIRKAFVPKYWNNLTHIVTFSAAGVPTISRRPAGALTTDQYTQMEANFSLFFGLAVQLYEATLIANDSPFDRFLEGSGAQTQQEAQGLATFDGSGNCTACHSGGELTNASVTEMLVNPVNPFLPPDIRKNPTNAIDFMSLLNGMAFYDTGFYNIGVRRTTEDIGRGGNSPFRNPAVPRANIPLSFSKLALLKFNSLLPPAVDLFVPPLPLGLLPTDTTPRPRRTDVNGAFKVPSLRNVELTGPYMHNGGHLTLAQVVDFYTRGGDFAAANVDDFSPNVNPIGKLRNSPGRMNEVVAFLLSLTDSRVKNESAPFDHPELLVPNGANPTTGEDAQFLRIPAVGNGGRPADGLAPLESFMRANPFAS